MKIESLKIVIDSDELEAALKCIEMPQNVRIRGAHFEPDELVVDLSVLAPIPLYPSFHVCVIQAAGPTVSFQVSTPLMTGLVDRFISNATTNLPDGVAYLGKGIVSLDIPTLANGTVSSINIGGIQFEDGHATVAVDEIDIDISAITQLSSVNRPGSV
ncbi:MAG TPA: hypothetical protein PLK04_10125 [Bacillota bacterium]|nr:hypothetical protein [Bacillota bacterium]HOK71171.1 hypothetical protein [Bacillota bacterium]HOL52195.1 hypothetical protein [Bacillota bacterium]HPQ02106.1 hypothetical protein [Bacillota bacterium]HPZ14578.1 hypothetical protein [Bacillota bacterium]